MKTSVLLATGVNAEGYRELLGMQVAPSESASSWTGFFRDLKARGLDEVYVVTSDVHLGIQLANSDVLPNASWQRCCTHLFRQEPFSDGAQDSLANAIGDVSYDIPTTRLRIVWTQAKEVMVILRAEIPTRGRLPGRSLR